jgi:hypothetical protein
LLNIKLKKMPAGKNSLSHARSLQTNDERCKYS